MWGATLSRPLRIIGLVGRYPTNYLIRRRPIPKRIAALLTEIESANVCGISSTLVELFPTRGQVTYVLRTRLPLTRRIWSVRLACVKHAASVHPEPGSNSP